jgi:adenylate cyclase/guanylate cyclase
VAGVIGNRKLFFDVWGDTVNMASRMESHGAPSGIQVTESIKEALEDDFRFETRGEINIKGLGAAKTWWLIGRK